MFQKILVAFDESPAAHNSIVYARNLAMLTDAQVVVLHAYSKTPDYLGEPNLSETIAKKIDRANQLVASVIPEFEKNAIPVTVEILEGPAADAILKVAAVRNVDLIVMGNRGLGSVASVLLGSVSLKVLAHAHAPVMIVHAEED